MSYEKASKPTPEDTFMHHLHYLASVILLLTVTMPDQLLPLWMVDLEPLEKYGASVLLMIVITGSIRYIRTTWKVFRE